MTSSCPDDHRLQSLLEGCASKSEVTLLTSHLDGCHQCQQQLDALTGAADLIPSQQYEPIIVTRTLKQVITGLKTASSPKTRSQQPDQPPESQRPSFLGISDKPGYIGKLGPYEVINVVGYGGMGVVLKAHDPSLDRIVAIKVLSAQLASSEEARKRFSREARTAAAVIHDNIVPIYSVDESAGLPYLVMPFITGGSIQEQIDKIGALPLADILRIGHQTASGLAAAHEGGLVHRDIKPNNILIEKSNYRIKIADFGLARACDELPITQTGFIAGTPQYMAPEQAMEQRVDHRADLFSLGSVLYVMCTGQLPFPQQSTIATIRSVCDDTPPPIREINPDIPQWLAQTVERLMTKVPERRIQSAQQVVEIFEEHLPAALSTSTRIINEPVVTTNPSHWLRAMTAFGVVLLITLVFLLTTNRTIDKGKSEPTSPTFSVSPVESSNNQLAPKDTPSSLSLVSAAPPPTFTILENNNTPSSKYDRLNDAVAQARTGDTIEIHGNGDVPTAPIQIQGKPLIIRAAAGFNPILMPIAPSTEPLISTDSALVLEGLTIQNTGTTQNTSSRTEQWPERQNSRVIQISTQPAGVSLIQTTDPFYATNCRFLIRSFPDNNTACLNRQGQHLIQLNNCELYVQKGGAVYCNDPIENTAPTPNGLPSVNSLAIRNCVQAGVSMFSLGSTPPKAIRLTRNTFAGGCLILYRSSANKPPHPNPTLQVQASSNVFDIRALLVNPSHDETTLAEDLIEWQGQYNAFSTAPFLSANFPRRKNRFENLKQLREWNSTLGSSINNTFHGNVFYSSSIPPFKHIVSNHYRGLGPETFRIIAIKKIRGKSLKSESLKKIGAITDIVGPGQAYEVFKQSDEYQEWAQTIHKAIRLATSTKIHR